MKRMEMGAPFLYLAPHTTFYSQRQRFSSIRTYYIREQSSCKVVGMAYNSSLHHAQHRSALTDRHRRLDREKYIQTDVRQFLCHSTALVVRVVLIFLIKATIYLANVFIREWRRNWKIDSNKEGKRTDKDLLPGAEMKEEAEPNEREEKVRNKARTKT